MHATAASCRKCHALTDPIGLGLESFDGIGKFRLAENESTIDTSGDFDGAAFSNAAELGQAFAESPLVSACLVENLYRYAVGRKHTNGERRLLRYLEDTFAGQGYRVPALMGDIATSEAFRTATAPSPQAPKAQTVKQQTTDTDRTEFDDKAHVSLIISKSKPT
jgi:hypothetical protein